MNKISVITVTYNSERTIKGCLESIKNYSPESEIIVVDNGSKDETVKIVKNFGRRIKLVEAGKNLGFSKGNNLGVKDASGEYLVFLNPDAMLTKKGDLEHLQKILADNSDYGILSPRLIYPDKTPQPKARNLPTLSRAFEEYVLGVKGAYSFYDPKCSNLCEVESITGACMMITKALFEKVKDFDEKYFMYYEDLALCNAVRSLGYRVGFVPDVVVVHAEGASGKNQKTNKLMRDSAKKYFGLPAYYLMESLFFYNRLMNRFRKMIGQSVHV